ncbi:MAG: hypothetical protein R3192_02955 [Woeseiaceae bacterium]|nr:hypothetical protein [Woeseiaceae bacterium]
MTIRKILPCGGLLAIALSVSAPAVADEADESSLARGRYLVELGGCNDCHTAGYAVLGGTTPESEWLLGDGLGYRGPWGTTYPPNLRTYVEKLTEDTWVAVAKSLRTRPPMPWWALNGLTEVDSRAMYRFIKSLGAVATEVPAYVPPGQEPATPFIRWPDPPE